MTTPPIEPEVDQEAPEMPARPIDQSEDDKVKTLREAFPGVEETVIRAILQASRGNIDRSINALLSISDPSYKFEPESHNDSHLPTTTPRNQVEADEQYARRLAADYDRRIAQNQSDRSKQQKQQRASSEERETSFLDDDLPVIKENLKQGFNDAKTKVNAWVTKLKNRIDGDGQVSNDEPLRYKYKRQPSESYDADHRVLDDNFSELHLQDNTIEQKTKRPAANPNLFKSGGSPEVSTTQGSDQPSRWEPLKMSYPANQDPFALDDDSDGDAEEPKKTKQLSNADPSESSTLQVLTEEKKPKQLLD
ncbi:CUE domain-containing protein 5 [Neolecta irregularis DAH-3]|uniref:CUE domain-containing protein 5 n=1 Tax=Neolecta irregularis (strain DAH-3) TaxID=1198029 RepID=A0A1U7LIC0_NEOID|nr:CUE domain-containing protein 5 [Neolecta irregularis DAH-3]|eukprot:OLL22406.1 CUE domain-containing protein 5 [Neolecta irregularis DAH-3]